MQDHNQLNHTGSQNMTLSIEEFFITHNVDPNFDEILYESKYPETKEFYQPYCKINNIDDKHRLYYHDYFFNESKIVLMNKTKTIFIKPTNEFSNNRLLFINSCHNFAKCFGFKSIKICWEKIDEFDRMKLKELFDSYEKLYPSIEFIDLKSYNEAENEYFCLHKNLSNTLDFTKDLSEVLDIITKESFCYSHSVSLEYIFEYFPLRDTVLLETLKNKYISIFGKTALSDYPSTNKPNPIKVPDLSLVVALKNRFKMLKISVQSWIQQPEIKEIVIVNWSSDDFDHQYLVNLDPRIRIVDVLNQKYYHVSKAINTAMKSASCDHILKVDVDHIFNPFHNLSEWLNLNWDNEFLTGYWRQNVLDNHIGFIENLHGLIAISKENYFKSGGYNEKMTGWGWEDCDIYNRLMSELKLKRRYIYLNSKNVPVYHNPHSDTIRVMNYEIKDKIESCKNNKNKSQYKVS